MAGIMKLAFILALSLFSQVTDGLNLGRNYALNTAAPSRANKSASPPVAIAVFGGSGRVGTEVVHQQLLKGGPVHCLVRNKNKLTVPPGTGGSIAGAPMVGAHVVEGDIKNEEDVEKVFKGQNIKGVIVCVGGKTSKVGKTMCTDGTRNVINACKKYGVKNIAVVTSIGCGETMKIAPFFFKLLMKTMMSKIMKDKNNQEALFLAPDAIGKDLDFVIVRPGGLTLEKPSGVINTDGKKAGTISRADVASFLIDCVSDKGKMETFKRKAVCLSSDQGTGWTKDRSEKAQGKAQD